MGDGENAPENGGANVIGMQLDTTGVKPEAIEAGTLEAGMSGIGIPKANNKRQKCLIVAGVVLLILLVIVVVVLFLIRAHSGQVEEDGEDQVAAEVEVTEDEEEDTLEEQIEDEYDSG